VELLKEKPKFVTMIEIDEMVMNICKVHMRSACGTCLDSYCGSNYRIIVDDCIIQLNQYIANNVKFDYVFEIWTDMPIAIKPKSQFWEFMQSILELSLQVLRPKGKFMTHANGVSSQASLTCLRML